MNNKIILFALLALIMASCNNGHDDEKHDLSEEPKIQLTAYSNDFELFAEADLFVTGKTTNVLSHFSCLPGFKALETGQITISLIVNEQVLNQTLDKPSRKGIYSFDITPATTGIGKLVYNIEKDNIHYQIMVPEITVYATEKEAAENAEKGVLSETNTIFFSKEQSWKIDFATEILLKGPFGQVIKTTALIQSAQGDEVIISAKTNGMAMMSSSNIFEGESIVNGQFLFKISGSGMADNNLTVRLAEAKSNYDKAKADYERLSELREDKIVSEKDFVAAKNHYENSKAIYDNLHENFSDEGQSISSPISGFIKQVFVQNGQYVEAGQALLSVSQNKSMILRAEVQQKYASLLGSIISANIRTLHNNQVYTLEQLEGKILSYGRSTNNDNYLIPVNLQINNTGDFVSGGFVEIYLKTLTNYQALTVPNPSILEDQGAFFVFVQITPELFEKREVKVGATDGLRTEIERGVDQNERVVTKGALLIKLAQASGTLDAHSGHVH